MTITTSAPTSGDLAQDDLVVGRLVDELMSRVPAGTDRAALERAGRRAALDVRLHGAETAGACDVEAAARAAVTAALRAMHGNAAVVWVRTAAPGRVDAAAEVAALVHALPVRQRRIVEGYFAAVREVTELAEELRITVPELVAERQAALRSLRDGYVAAG